jgi:glutaredoxin
MVLRDVVAWLRRRQLSGPSALRFTVYSRRGCHLCEEALELLRREQRAARFEMTVTDVDTEPGLVEQYGSCVPVVLVDGKVRFRGRVNPVLLRRLLRATATART